MKKRIDLLLVEKNLVKTRAKGQAMIMAGQVSINGNIIKKSGELHNVESEICIKKLNPQWVSRGAYKLLHAINYFDVHVEDLVCLDIGASTGGFTDVLLHYKAKKIYAVDVGTNQLHEKLKNDSKVINIEKTNARYLDKSIIDENIDLIVCDTSFISLKKVLKNSFIFLKSPGGIIVALIKPQFEADKKEISRGGVVKNSLVHKKICNEFTKWFNDICNMNVVGIIESPIKGPKGNVEFLIVVKN
jgi:23S rRNA (cytidine1920-2'-O)/16S rRNA (cytidine1409-2'-O)-methyltransferase